MAHTPTPWNVQYRAILDQDGFQVAAGSVPDDDIVMMAHYDLAAENAAFIVKACNAHEALVEAVQQAIKFLEATSYTPGQEAGVLWDLKEALALTSAQRGGE